MRAVALLRFMVVQGSVSGFSLCPTTVVPTSAVISRVITYPPGLRPAAHCALHNAIFYTILIAPHLLSVRSVG